MTDRKAQPETLGDFLNDDDPINAPYNKTKPQKTTPKPTQYNEPDMPHLMNYLINFIYSPSIKGLEKKIFIDYNYTNRNHLPEISLILTSPSITLNIYPDKTTITLKSNGIEIYLYPDGIKEMEIEDDTLKIVIRQH